MLIDTHTHISREFYSDIDSVIENSKDNNVKYLIVSFCELEEIKAGFDYLEKYDNVFFTIGYHPDQADLIKDSDLEFLKELIISNNKIVGIGEIGLDYHYGKENRNQQIELFEKQLKLAEELNLPVVIHSRDAINDTQSILSKYKLKGVIHCFSGSYEVANEYIKMGFLLGIGGVVTFKNAGLQDVVKRINLESIVLETDSPYLSPEPFRGEKNESKNVLYVAKKVSELKEVTLSEIEEVTSSNAVSLFDLDI